MSERLGGNGGDRERPPEAVIINLEHIKVRLLPYLNTAIPNSENSMREAVDRCARAMDAIMREDAESRSPWARRFVRFVRGRDLMFRRKFLARLAEPLRSLSSQLANTNTILKEHAKKVERICLSELGM